MRSLGLSGMTTFFSPLDGLEVYGSPLDCQEENVLIADGIREARIEVVLHGI